MLKEYPKFKVGQIEDIHKKLSKAEKQLILDYLDYRKARGVGTEDKLKDIRRYLLHERFILEKEFNKIDLKDLRVLLGIINNSRLTTHTQNNLKADLKNFLKYLFKDWSMRFNDFEDIRLGSNSKNEEKINSTTLVTKEEVETLVKKEPKMFWKAFLLTQYEAGLRTIEVRSLKWEDIKFNVDGDISEINIFATKTKKSRTIFVEKSTFYLKSLKEEQENLDSKSIYVFPSRQNLNKPIDKSAVNMWFRRLSKRVLGKVKWNYLLRHSRATELYKLANENKISKDTAIKFMGHSEDMSKTYTHLDKEDVKKMLKNQVYKIEDLPEERKHALEKENQEIKKELEQIRKAIGFLTKNFEKLKG